MKNFKSTNHHELRQRCSVNLGKVQKTDQSYKKMCDINVIIANASKTGVLSHQQSKVAQYIDNTEIPSLMEAHAVIRDAQESFMTLPSQIRKLMDHDPTKLADFVSNPENLDILVKHGILEERKKVEPIAEQKDDPPKAKPAVEKKTQEE